MQIRYLILKFNYTGRIIQPQLRFLLNYFGGHFQAYLFDCFTAELWCS